jgi:hypothetical protein
MTELEQADEIAGKICRMYSQLGSAAFVIRTTSSGDIRVVGQYLPPAAVAKMLHSAADAYLKQSPDVTHN